MAIKENNDTYYIRNLLYLRSEKLRNVQDKSIILTNKTRKLFNKNRQQRPSTRAYLFLPLRREKSSGSQVQPKQNKTNYAHETNCGAKRKQNINNEKT